MNISNIYEYFKYFGNIWHYFSSIPKSSVSIIFPLQFGFLTFFFFLITWELYRFPVPHDIPSAFPLIPSFVFSKSFPPVQTFYNKKYNLMPRCKFCFCKKLFSTIHFLMKGTIYLNNVSFYPDIESKVIKSIKPML